MTDANIAATLIANGPYARDDAPFRLLSVTGPDAEEFLQRLCSQDVAGLPDGQVRPAAFLDAKGKVQATALVCRSGEAFWLEVQATQAERLHELLDRYHFTERLTLQLHGAGACRERIAAVEGDGERRAEVGDDGALLVRFARRGVQFERGHAASATAVGDGRALGDDGFEALRMVSGTVRVGEDTEPTTLALEADLDDHCSTSKGCYTGQEIVARIHTYGHVNRALCLLQLPDGDAIREPVALEEPEDGVPVGRVLRAVPVAVGDARARLGLGYLPRDFQAAGTALRLPDGGDVQVLAFAADA